VKFDHRGELVPRDELAPRGELLNLWKKNRRIHFRAKSFRTKVVNKFVNERSFVMFQEQGDKIGRFYAYWHYVVYFGQFFKYINRQKKFWLLLSDVKVMYPL
jgi:hypothetical protein